MIYGDQDGKLDTDFPLSNGQSSLDSTFQIDLTTGFNLSENVFAGLNATYNTSSAGEIFNGSSVSDLDGEGAGFYGITGYLKAATSEKFSIGTRAEYFKGFNGVLGGVGTNNEGDGSIAITLTGNAKVAKNLTIIPELRLDTMKEDFFVNPSLSTTKNLSSFILAVVFSF